MCYFRLVIHVIYSRRDIGWLFLELTVVIVRKLLRLMLSTGPPGATTVEAVRQGALKFIAY